MTLRALLIVVALHVALAGPMSAQTCLGVPIGGSELAAELHYDRPDLGHGVGASLSASLPGGFFARGRFTHRGYRHGSIEGRAAWELRGASFSLCPTVAAEYGRARGSSFVVVPVGIAIASAPAPGSELELSFLAFPHYMLRRYWIEEFRNRPAETIETRDLAATLGLRVARGSFFGGVSATFSTESEDSHWMEFVAGFRTGSAPDSREPDGRPLRDRFGISLGGMSVSETDHPFNHCGTGTGMSLGAEVRTRGRWLLATGVDLLANFLAICEDILVITTYQGEQVDVTNEVAVAGPRFSARAGRGIELAGFVLEPTLNAGWIYMPGGDGQHPNRDFWSQWLGAGLGFRVNPDKAVLVEYGWRQLPFFYYRDQVKVHTFSERKPLLRVVLEL